MWTEVDEDDDDECDAPIKRVIAAQFRLACVSAEYENRVLEWIISGYRRAARKRTIAELIARAREEAE